MPPAPLPIDPHLPRIAAAVREHRALVLSAAPGAGKTTRVPPALASDGPVIVLQPRRIAARSIARRIAEEQGWTPGREVGWQVRFERQFSPATRILLATEGILTARLQQDPLLSGFRTVILDEFHERSIHADLGLALTRQAWLARDDLRVVVMSATMDVAPVSAYLDGAPVIEARARLHEIVIRYEPSRTLPAVVAGALDAAAGQVLCFLPGAPEIRRAVPDVAAAAGSRGADVVTLHGSMSAEQQDAALTAVAHRRVILATNIAETSLTVPGVRAVVDTGVHKVARYDPARGIDSLDTERVTQDSADQRAGRAGRLGPGTAWRLWSGADRLRPYAEPEIRRIDLSGPVLEILAWGGDPRSLAWFEPPPEGAMDAAFVLLEQLGAVRDFRLTDLGRRMQALPVHPRLARILLEANGAREVALACALLSERHFSRTADRPDARGSQTTSSDLLSAVMASLPLPPHVVRVAGELQRLCGGGGTAGIGEQAFRRALFAGYPDRVARRRSAGSPRVLMASGHGAVIGEESGVRDGEFIAALDVSAARRGETAEARIRIASIVDRAWLEPAEIRLEHELDVQSGRVKAWEREYYGAVLLNETPVQPDPGEAARILAAAYLRRPVGTDDEQLLRRLRFAGMDASLDRLIAIAAQGRTRLDEIDPRSALSREERSTLDRDAPDRLPIPGGRTVRLEYQDDGGVRAEVRLQSLFGVTETPRIGPRQEPVLLALLAPNGRPVQLTRDLRSFWERTYPEVRKELRGRYPKHAWPEKP